MPRMVTALPMMRTFEAVTRHGSFSAASREIGVTPSAISQQMQLLEGRLGVALFVRHARGLTVTRDGQRFANDVATALEQLDGAVARLTSRQAHGPLCVSTVGSFALQWLMPRLGGFRARYPDIDLLLSAEQRPVDLHAREADLAIRFGSGTYPGLWSVQLMLDCVFPLAAPGLVSGQMTVRDLIEQNVLIEDVSTGPYEPSLGWARWIRDAGASSRFQIMRLGDSMLALDATMRGEGVMLARASIAARVIADGHAIRPVQELKATEGAYHIVAPLGGPVGPAAAFAEWIAAKAAEFAAQMGEDYGGPLGDVAQMNIHPSVCGD